MLVLKYGRVFQWCDPRYNNLVFNLFIEHKYFTSQVNYIILKIQLRCHSYQEYHYRNKKYKNKVNFAINMLCFFKLPKIKFGYKLTFIYFSY